MEDLNLNTIDEATASLILALQIADAQSLLESSIGKGKTKEGVFSDAQLALKIYEEELERNALIIADRKMTISVARACQTDGRALAAAVSQEQVAAMDREEACKLGGMPIPVPVDPWTVGSEFLDEEVLEKLSALYLLRPGEEDSGPAEGYGDGNEVGRLAESSEWAASRARQGGGELRRCEACHEDIRFYDLVRVPCGHEYCRDCLGELFATSLIDDTLFPPRCCKQTIISSTVRMFLSSSLLRQYEAKKIEYETPNRTYCSNPTCSVFIKVEDGKKGEDCVTCSICACVTCVICKGPEHIGDCPEDTVLQEVLATAAENGWQRCGGCKRLVELDMGCNHITCPCGSQFCYLCSETWKTCPCEQWNEDRLLARGNQIVQRGPAQANREQRVAAVVQNLRSRHNCLHNSWRYVSGSHQCEECYATLPSYIFECQQCNIQACNRCRNNRL